MAAVRCRNCLCSCSGFSLTMMKAGKPTNISGNCAVTSWRAFSTGSFVLNQENHVPRKKRDRLTVLKALSSTVEQIPNRPDYRFYDDLILNPRSMLKQKELLLAIESGSKAADYVLETYPHLFPLREAVPAWSDSLDTDAEIEDSPQNLKLLLKSKDNSLKALAMYERLKTAGDFPIDIHNVVLDYVSFHAIPNSNGSTATTVEDESSSTSSSSSSDEESNVNEKRRKPENMKKTKWRSDGYAEMLFDELRKNNANAQTYEVFILGLLEHEEYIRAFHLFEEFKGKKYQGSTSFYNQLLSHVCDVRTGDKDRWDLVEDITSYMATVSVAANSVTFISILAVAYERENEPQRMCQNVVREMKRMGIVPSLGCYYYVLLAERKKNYQNIQLLYEILDDLKKGAADFNLQHPADMMFFHSAMDLARFKRSGRLAKDLLDIVLSNRLQHMLGTKNSSFFGNYLCAVARNALSIEEVFIEYERIVPKFLIPRDWVFQQLFMAVRNHNDPQYVPRLYADMVSMRVPLSERVALSMYQAMSENVPKDKIGDFLHVALDAKKWLKVFNVAMTSEISSTILKLLCIGEKYLDALELLDEITSQGIVPSQQSMLYLLDLNIQQEDKPAAMNTLKRMKAFGMPLDDAAKDIINTSTILIDKRAKIEDMFQVT